MLFVTYSDKLPSAVGSWATSQWEHRHRETTFWFYSHAHNGDIWIHSSVPSQYFGLSVPSRLKYLNNYRTYYLKFGSDIHDKQRLNPTDFCDPEQIRFFLLIQWNISSSAGWICTKFCSDFSSFPDRRYVMTFGDLLTFLHEVHIRSFKCMGWHEMWRICHIDVAN